MISTKHFINIISVFLIWLISILFLLKYTIVYSKTPAVIIILISYTAAFLGMIFFFYKKDLSAIKLAGKKYWRIYYIILFALSLFYIFSFDRFGSIGRQPAIDDWLNFLLNGQYPYNSEFLPSGFPGLFLTALPFYLFGNSSLIIPVGMGIFLFFNWLNTDTANEISLRSIMLFFSPVIIYEFAVRSELFFNMVLVIAIIYLIDKYIDPHKMNFPFFLLAVLSGVVLSTRIVTAVIFLIYFLYFFRSNFKSLVIFSAMAWAVFLILLLPFITWNIESFKTNGPFSVQSAVSYLPFAAVIVFLACALIMGWLVSNLQEVFFAAGLWLFGIVIFSFLLKIIGYGFYTAFIEDKIDLSYLIFCFPFFILAIKEYKVDKFLGRILDE